MSAVSDEQHTTITTSDGASKHQTPAASPAAVRQLSGHSTQLERIPEISPDLKQRVLEPAAHRPAPVQGQVKVSIYASATMKLLQDAVAAHLVVQCRKCSANSTEALVEQWLNSSEQFMSSSGRKAVCCIYSDWQPFSDLKAAMAYLRQQDT